MQHFSSDDIQNFLGCRLDIFLVDILKKSRSSVQALIEGGHVTLDPAPVRVAASYKIKAGVRITVDEPESVVMTSELIPENIPLEILHEDEHVIVLNKQPGLVVHPAAGNYTGTLVHALLYHCGSAEALAERGGPERMGIVHRLDKDTSGAMVVAKTNLAHEALSRQFHDREVSKSYVALAWGELRHSQGEMRGDIGRHPKHRQKMAVLTEGGGRYAHTSFKLEEQMPLAARVRCQLHTGRTHQIRVHLAELGHPIVGDDLYGRARQHPGLPPADRQMLHSAELEFFHPVGGKGMRFEAPVPPDFAEMEAALRVCVGASGRRLSGPTEEAAGPFRVGKAAMNNGPANGAAAAAAFPPREEQRPTKHSL
ncbi:MAG: RluA family pseudouridine synthase [Candidatus Methylacidiphilales bacterium]